MPKVISNTTPIISLLKIGQLSLLKHLYGEIIVPKAVYSEIEKGRNKSYYTDILKVNWIRIEEIKNRKPLSYLLDLDAGEAEVVVLATEIDADLVIIDETLGRRFATHSGLKLTGTIGVLIKAKEVGLVKRILPLVDDLQQKGIWISDKLKEKILDIVNE